jgi:hypothetical protein
MHLFIDTPLIPYSVTYICQGIPKEETQKYLSFMQFIPLQQMFIVCGIYFNISKPCYLPTEYAYDMCMTFILMNN